jgi:hypothetical protein
VTVTGFHDDAAFGRCDGSIVLKIKGSFFSSLAGPLALLLTLLSALGLFVSARPRVGAQ